MLVVPISVVRKTSGWTLLPVRLVGGQFRDDVLEEAQVLRLAGKLLEAVALYPWRCICVEVVWSP